MGNFRMEEIMKERKIIIMFFVFIFLCSFSFAYTNKIIGVKVERSENTTKIQFKTSEEINEIPDYFDNKENSRGIILKFNNISLADSFKKFNFSSKLGVNDIVFEEEGEKVLAYIELKKKAPFRIYKNEKDVLVELYNNYSENLVEEKNNTIDNEKSVNEFVLEKIKVKNENSGMNVGFKFKNKTPTYETFFLDNPKRLVFDLFDTVNNVRRKKLKIGKYGVSTVRAGQNRLNPRKVTRVVFDLYNKSFDYFVNNESRNLLINFSTEEPKSIEKESVEIKDEPFKIKNEIDLENNSSKEIKLEVKPEERANTKPGSEQVKKSVEFETKTLASEEIKYQGDLITLRLKDADIRDVLREIVRKAGINLIVDPGVSGTVTCELVKVPWDQALDLILKSNNLGKVLEGNVLRIGKSDVLAAEERMVRQLNEARKLEGPLKTVSRRLSYSKVSGISKIVKNELSKRGSMITDERTNNIIITDIEPILNKIQRIIDTLDTPTLQVNIKTRIVETNSSYTKNLGIQWGFKGIQSAYYGNQTSLSFPNNYAVNGSSVSSPQGIYGPLGGYAVNLPAPAMSSAIGVTMGNVLDTFRLDAAITALQNEGKAKILSQPEITTQNNKRAEIIQGRKIPIQTMQGMGSFSVRYVNAALELNVTPHITAEGTINLDVEIKNDNADWARTVNGRPPIITQSAKTSVLVKDGGTSVIGGIYKIENNVVEDKVPGLGDLPIIGNLFKGTQKSGENRELLIFITPRIVK